MCLPQYAPTTVVKYYKFHKVLYYIVLFAPHNIITRRVCQRSGYRLGRIGYIFPSVKKFRDGKPFRTTLLNENGNSLQFINFVLNKKNILNLDILNPLQSAVIIAGKVMFSRRKYKKRNFKICA